MTIESARAAVEEALTNALKGEATVVSPTEHGISAAELSEIANEEMARRTAVAKLDVDYVTESQDEDGTVEFRPVD
jgi:hypothetical protein